MIVSLQVKKGCDMAFKIEVTRLGPMKEGDRYPPSEKIYEQTVENLNVKRVIDAVNDAPVYDPVNIRIEDLKHP